MSAAIHSLICVYVSTRTHANWINKLLARNKTKIYYVFPSAHAL